MNASQTDTISMKRTRRQLLSIPAHILRGLRQLVMAESCPACGRISKSDEYSSRLCDECSDEIDRLAAASYCPACGHGMGATGSCAVCAHEKPPVGAVVRVGAYEGVPAEMVRRLKFREAHVLLRPVAGAMLEALHRRGLGSESFDVAVAIPLHWWDFWRRGYNQSQLLLRQMQHLGLKVPQRRLLVKIRRTRPQVGLSGESRRRNVRGSFAARRPEAIRGRRILLIDDVLTTGATAGACARQLHKAGAASVTVLVAAVAGVNQKA